ncbi:MAG: T9SS type A sorting domain-containing protein [Bacteroidota bacterium]|nr:T9SS type A sorting domain-containing protein [Bacteroidota bacterium]
MNQFKTIFIYLFLVSITFEGISQISQKMQPYSSSYQFDTSIPYYSLKPVNTDSLLEIDNIQHGVKLFRFAFMIDVDFDIKEKAAFSEIPEGRFWRMGIVSSQALSLYTEFSSFNLPKGAALFLYNPEKSHVLGAFTNQNNKVNHKLAILPIVGDTLIIEYFEPGNTESDNPLTLGRIGHDYRGIVSILNKAKDGSFGNSGDCNVDINCFEGDDWQREKHSVCRIIANGAICSGSLVNNTNQDARPLFLTANHCISNQAAADNMICVFNYESQSCNGDDGSVEQSISGGTVRATTHFIDFCLIELSTAPLPSFQPYFAGWDRSIYAAHSTVCIHHPQGDVKKISKDFDPPTSNDYPPYTPNTHWKIHDWDLGTTEGGSSGSPLFNQEHRIIGDLTGGEASCTYNFNDYYSKFASAWDTYPETESQLKYWLDPANTGTESLNGYNPYWGQQAPIADFSSNQTNILKSSMVDFTDLSKGNVNSWHWHFAGATPSSSTDQHPKNIKYTYQGTFNVKLIVENTHGNNEIIRSGYITVQDHCGDFSNIEEEEGENLFLYTFSEGGGYWTGHNQYIFTGFAEKYTNQSGHYIHGLYILPAIVDYTTPASKITAKIWEGGASPGSVLYQNDLLISSFTSGVWKFIAIDPAIETTGNFFAGFEIYYNNADTFAVPHSLPRGINGKNTAYIKQSNIWKPISSYSPQITISLCVDAFLCGSLNEIEELESGKGLRIFPNPASDYIMFDLPDEKGNIGHLQILAVTGRLLFDKDINSDDDIFELNISRLKPGVYFIKIFRANKVQVASFIKL